MPRTLALFLLIFAAAPTAFAKRQCEISGNVKLWSYDACLWHNETDDTIHPGVIACVERNDQTIARYGACKAKRIFKDRICAKVDDRSYADCMAKDEPLGASVRDGGI